MHVQAGHAAAGYAFRANDSTQDVFTVTKEGKCEGDLEQAIEIAEFTGETGYAALLKALKHATNRQQPGDEDARGDEADG